MIAFSEIDIAYEGRNAGIEARRAGGHDPTDCEGRSLLPAAPQDGDWNYLAELLGRDPTAGERTAFARGYEDGVAAGEWVQRGGHWMLVGT